MPSPPVPTMSMAFSGAETGSMRARMEETAPTISSTVSPRTRSAIRKPPICDGVASPDIRMSKAARDSSRFRLSPFATFAISGFSSAIVSAPRLEADHRLIGEGLIDGHTVVVLQAVDHLVEHVVACRAGDGGELLIVIGKRIGRRVGVDCRDLEEDAAGTIGVCRGARHAFSAGEYRRDRLATENRVLAGAAQARFLLDGKAEFASHRCQCLALFDACLQLVGLGGKRRALLLCRPVGHDIVAHFGKRAVAGGDDLIDVEPDVAFAAEIDRQGFGAGFGLEDFLGKLRRGQVLNGVALCIKTGGIDGVDGDGLEVQTALPHRQARSRRHAGLRNGHAHW